MGPQLRALIPLLVFLVVVIGGLMLFAVARSQPLEHVHCVDSEEREEHIRAITLKAIDDALANHVERLFEFWMKDQHEQPRRAMTGMNIAISAHIRARNNAIAWSPPRCKEPNQ